MLKLCAAGCAEQAPAYPATSVSNPRVQDSFSGAVCTNTAAGKPRSPCLRKFFLKLDLVTHPAGCDSPYRRTPRSGEPRET